MLCVADAAAEGKFGGIEEIIPKFHDFIVFSDSALAVDAAGATLVTPPFFPPALCLHPLHLIALVWCDVVVGIRCC